MYDQNASSVPLPLLVVLVLWLTIIFVSFGLFAPRNATVVANLFVSALSGSEPHSSSLSPRPQNRLHLIGNLLAGEHAIQAGRQ